MVSHRVDVGIQNCLSPREKFGLFSDFQYGFRSSRSTSDLLKIVSDRIARAINRSGATLAVTLGISKAFGRVWHAGLLHKLKSYEKYLCLKIFVGASLQVKVRMLERNCDYQIPYFISYFRFIQNSSFHNLRNYYYCVLVDTYLALLI